MFVNVSISCQFAQTKLRRPACTYYRGQILNTQQMAMGKDIPPSSRTWSSAKAEIRKWKGEVQEIWSNKSL